VALLAAGLIIVAGIVLPLYFLGGVVRPSVNPKNPRNPRAKPVHLAAAPTVTQLALNDGISGITTGFGAVWVEGLSGVVYRITPSTDTIAAQISLTATGDPGPISAGSGGIWATDESGLVAEIDPSTNQIIGSVNIGSHISGIAAGGGQVFATITEDSGSSLVLINPQTWSHVKALALPGDGAGPITYYGGTLWITNTSSGGSVTHVDSQTLSIIPTVSALQDITSPIAAAPAEVWAATSAAAIEVDATTGAVVQTVPIAQAAQVAVGNGSEVWALQGSGSTSSTTYEPDPNSPESVVQIDPVLGQPIPGTATSLGQSPSSLAVGEGGAWVADLDSGIVWHVVALSRNP
jgi:hypothetical protein